MHALQLDETAELLLLTEPDTVSRAIDSMSEDELRRLPCMAGFYPRQHDNALQLMRCAAWNRHRSGYVEVAR